MIHNFFKCADFTVSLIKYLSDSLVVILLSLLCNHTSLILKLHQKENATLIKDGFLLADSKLKVYQE